MDLFGDMNDYFGFNDYAIPREEWDVNSNALYEGDLLCSIKSRSQDISPENNTNYGLQCPPSYSNAWYGCSTAPFLPRHETMGYNDPVDDSTKDPLQGSQKAEINRSFPRHTGPEFPSSVESEHEYSNLFPDRVPVNVMSDMFQVPDTLKADTPFADLEKDTVQLKQEKDSKKSQGKSSGNMNSRNFMELYSIRRPSGRRDRHTKVVTSRGPRDRRMRLSVETAIKLFGVQDMLGFDQASKTIEWLIQKSSSAIDQLSAEFLSPFEKSSRLNTDSHYSLASLNHDRDRTDRADRTIAGFVTGSEEKVGEADSLSPTLLTEPSIVKQQSRSRCKRENPRKTGAILATVKTAGRWTHNSRLRELRFKARERARERTKEKRNRRASARSASPHMKHTTSLEVEGLNLQEKNASASSESTLNTLETSLNRLIGFSSIKGISLPAEDSVKVFGENLHLSGHSNLFLNYSQNQMQCFAQTVDQCYEDQLDKSMQSAGLFSGLCSTTFLGPRCLFCQPFPPMNRDFRSKISDLCVDYSCIATNSALGHGTTFYVGPSSHEQ